MRSEASTFVTDAVICAHNAAGTLAGVLERLPRRRLRSVVVVDRGSDDKTGQVARDSGALVLRQTENGYGSACKRAIAHLESLPKPPDAVVFVSADGTDAEADLELLRRPLESKSAELVIAVPTDRTVPGLDRVALGLIGVLYRHRFTGLGSFRAIRFPALVALSVADSGSGWDAEMQVKAVKLGLQIAEVRVGRGGVDVVDDDSGLARTGRMLFRILRHSTAR